MPQSIFNDAVHFSMLHSKLPYLSPFSLPQFSNLRPHTSQPHTPHHIPQSLTTIFRASVQDFRGSEHFYNATELRSSLSLSLSLSLSQPLLRSLCLSLSLPSLPPSLSVSLAVSLSHSLPAFVFSRCIRIVSFCTGLRVTGTQGSCSARKLHGRKQTWKSNINSNVIAVSVLVSKHFQKQASRATKVCDTVRAITQNCCMPSMLKSTISGSLMRFVRRAT